jgi:intracellular sulfur oxidation DsrE/DsrF family protein
MPEPVKVAFPVNHAGESVLRSCRALMRALQNPVQAEIVCCDAGVMLVLAGEPSSVETAELIAHGVSVAVCQRSLDARAIDRGALLGGVTVVPDATRHLLARERDGWHVLAF